MDNARFLPRIGHIFCMVKGQRPSKKARFRAGTTTPWHKVLCDFDSFTSVNPDYEPLRRLVHDLQSCAASDLHARRAMGGILLLSPEEELYHDDNILLVSYHPNERRFHFEHRMISKNNDSKDASNDEAWNTLRLFVGYKFGIRLPEARPSEVAEGDGGLAGMQ
jgi:hypothetical protein